MKRSNDIAYFLTPQAEGWAVWRGTHRLHIASTLSEAVGLLPATAAFEFAVPCHPLILERLRLPATEHDELAGMVHLQWEKALPFSPEEMTGSFAVTKSEADHVTVWTVAASRVALKEFGDAWSKAKRWPGRVTPYVAHVAASCPPAEIVLVVYGEQGHWVAAVVENRLPVWVHVMSATDAAGFAAEFSSLMLTAGLDGVPNEFARVLLAPEVAGAKPTLCSVVHAPVEDLPLITPATHLQMNLLPVDWQGAAAQDRQRNSWRHRALAAAAVYVLFAVIAGIDLFLLHHRAAKLEVELTAERPTLVALQSRQSRFNSLGAAIDSRRYTIEVLYLLNRCLPADTVHFTEFDQMPDQWRVVGEAPTPSLAIDYLSRLKHDPDLSSNDITADPPQMLANGAQFQVIGKP
ncbi:MAG TPA: hypothetical protein VGM54_01805 [Chthoniobacter sp.]|jgi:hypothetical protein